MSVAKPEGSPEALNPSPVPLDTETALPFAYSHSPSNYLCLKGSTLTPWESVYFPFIFMISIKFSLVSHSIQQCYTEVIKPIQDVNMKSRICYLSKHEMKQKHAYMTCKDITKYFLMITPEHEYVSISRFSHVTWELPPRSFFFPWIYMLIMMPNGME